MTSAYVARGEDRILDEKAREQARGSFVALSDGVTHYELAGPSAGPLVVLLPGITIPLGYWDPVVADLHGYGTRTLAYSTYGRGWSDRAETRYDQALFVRQLRELVEAVVPGERLHLVGTSMGGLIAMAYATSEGVPAPLSLTLIGPAGLAEQSSPVTRLLSIDVLSRVVGTFLGRRLLGSHLGHNVRSDQDRERLARLVGEPYRFQGSVYALLATLRDFPLSRQQDLYRRAGALPVPKLLLWGRHDRVTPIAHLDAVRDLLAPQQCREFAECGHMVPFEDPHTTARILAAFITTISGGRTHE